MAFMIFDLDRTVICSKHRASILPNGSLDLAHWRENSTFDMIMRDSLLPLAKSMRNLYVCGHTIIVCTARLMSNADFYYLAHNKLPYDFILHRAMHPEAETIGDAQLKVDLLHSFFTERGFESIRDAKAIMFDDNVKVIERLRREGVHVYDAIEMNAKLAA